MLLPGSKVAQFRCRDLLCTLSLCLYVTLSQAKESRDFGPGHHFVAAPTVQKKSQKNSTPAKADSSDHVSKEKPKPPQKKGVNIPLIAGLAGGGAVAVGGAVAAIVAAAQANKHHEGQQTATTPIPMVTTALTLPTQEGATVIEVADQSGFALGDVIQIDGEYNKIKGFSSIILDHPLGHAHAAGGVVQLVAAAKGVRKALTTQSIDKVLGGSFTEPLTTSTSAAARTRARAEEADAGSGSSGIMLIIIGLLICAVSICMVSLVMFCANKRASRSRDFDDDEEYSQVDDDEEDEEEDSDEEDYYEKSPRKLKPQVAMPPMQADPFAMQSSQLELPPFPAASPLVGYQSSQVV